MFRYFACLVTSLALLGCGLQGTRTQYPKDVHELLAQVEESIPLVAAGQHVLCHQRFSADKAQIYSCQLKVAEQQQQAMSVYRIVQEWLPILVDAIKNKDLVLEADAREKLLAALTFVPEQYEELAALSLRIAESLL